MSDTIDDQVQRAFETLAERVHTAVTDHVRAAAGQLSASVAADRQAAAAAHDAAGRRIAEDTERNVTATLREAFARRESERLNRLLRGVRALDAASSLSQALDILADIATDEAPRMVLFLVRADGLRAWSHAGFDALLGTAAFELSLADAGVAGEAVRQMTPQRAGADKEGRPAFAQDRAAGTFAAVPLSMNGQVIAVLCGEQPDATDASETLTSTFDIFARHAARVLESLTATRLAQLVSQPLAAASAAPPQ